MSTQARERARELRKAQRAIAEQRGRHRPVLIGGAVVIVVLLIAIIGTVVHAMNGRDSAKGELVTPKAATASGALLIGQASAPVKLAVYLDYMCPYCGRFETANSGEIDKLIAAGTAQLELHPLAFLDRMSQGTRYSTRAANALVTVADKAPAKATAMNAALFAAQPEENTEGLTDAKIAEVATGAGVPQDVVAQFSKGIYEPWLAKATQKAFDDGVQGTPTVKINGTVYKGDLYTAGPLTQAVTAAAGSR